MKNDKNFVAYSWIVLGVFARLLPLPPNVSPMNSISLFGGANLGRKAALGITLATLVASDILLAYLKGYQPFGYWTLFTYSGFAAIVLAGSFLKKNSGFFATLGLLVASSLGFWTWTNFGIWLTGDHGMYPRTMAGLALCFTEALPFLKNSLAGDLVWGGVFFLGFYAVKKTAPKFGWNVQSA
jgi:hypothetical protein